MRRAGIVLWAAAIALAMSPGRAGADLIARLYAIPAHADPADAAALDVRAAAFGQRDLGFVLRVRTRDPWRLAGLGHGRQVCVELAQGTSGGRACLVAGGAIYQARDAAGGFGSPHGIPVHVARLNRTTARAVFARRALRLAPGPLRWALTTRSRRGADRLPDAGTIAGRVVLLAQPRCFGAAAGHSCRNPLLDRAVFPAPDAAYVWPNSSCRPLARPGAAFDPCAFGVRAGEATATVALLGDSHAIHWRAALEVVAQARDWRGISITRPGCPFSTQIPASPSLGPAACLEQHRATLAWLARHRSVRTVFVSDWAEPPGGPQGGTAGYGGGPAAFGAMFDRLPRSVRRIVVLRDIPRSTYAGFGCVDARLAHRESLRHACGTPRGIALTPDPAVAAAQARRPRARIISLTSRMCGPRACYPVIGGVFVHKDVDHMNAVFSSTLGPFVLRALG